MNFDDLDAKMRVFETSHDFCVLPGVYMVARLDGRGFTRLTKEVHKFEAPFDERFRDHMLAVVQHLVGADFRVVYGYTQSDEISLLFQLEADLFNRKLRKLDSILAAEASAVFSLRLGAMGCFDCRISQLPNAELVREYFRWRQEDASRNALNAHCYWTLRKEGKSASSATNALKNLSRAEKNELLFQRGVNFNDLPAWQKRGSGVYWETFEKEGFNPKTGQTMKASRRRLKVDLELPMKLEYDEFLAVRIQEATNCSG
ncbi:tRNA(His) guanylyltransferase Thg1 family protein [Roseimicrobium sp. ORNL1]|uniref:tRNA(His) guanylyltransferase Thg1 family protein n=1 Tax=Roseimicrobium sp. ORNL1 TaxID=2711231 RepID=UPI0013E1BA28|nr:tRNA(His) guanylyltransferase Thg1 family protein [Roseimicrobium sp. ORNL1]QIF04958.1 guanylyltransferase [Roseimicrobium sp. ORNL1]